MDSIHNFEFLTLIGFITAVLYALSPLIFIIKIIFAKNIENTEKFSILSLLFMYCNSFIYFTNSIFKRKTEDPIEMMDFCNLITAVLSLVYLIIYSCKIHKNYTIVFLLIISVVSLIFGFILYIFVHKSIDPENSIVAKITEWTAIIFNVLEYLPIGFDIRYFFKNKTCEKIIRISAIIGLSNCLSWLIWGISSIIYHVIVANIISSLLCIIQLILYFKYCKNESKISNDTIINNCKIEPLVVSDEIKRSNSNEKKLQNFKGVKKIGSSQPKEEVNEAYEDII